MKTLDKFRLYFLVYTVAVLVSVSLQTVLKLFFMDPITGFYLRGNTLAFVLALCLSIIVAGAILFWFIAMFVYPTKHDYALDYVHRPTSILSILTGLSILLYTIFDALKQVTSPLMSVSWQKNSYFIILATGVLAAISMIVGGIQPAYGRFGKPGAVLGVFPAIWQLFLLIVRFNSFMAITTISDVLFHVLFMCFASVFLLGQSRLIYGLGVRHGGSYAFPSGFATSLLGFCLIIPNFIYYAINAQVMPSVQLSGWETLYVLLLSIYAIVFLRGYSKSIKKV